MNANFLTKSLLTKFHQKIDQNTNLASVHRNRFQPKITPSSFVNVIYCVKIIYAEVNTPSSSFLSSLTSVLPIHFNIYRIVSYDFRIYLLLRLFSYIIAICDIS